MPDTRKQQLDKVDPSHQGPLNEGDVAEPEHEDKPMVPLIPVRGAAAKHDPWKGFVQSVVAMTF